MRVAYYSGYGAYRKKSRRRARRAHKRHGRRSIGAASRACKGLGKRARKKCMRRHMGGKSAHRKHARRARHARRTHARRHAHRRGRRGSKLGAASRKASTICRRLQAQGKITNLDACFRRERKFLLSA